VNPTEVSSGAMTASPWNIGPWVMDPRGSYTELHMVGTVSNENDYRVLTGKVKE